MASLYRAGMLLWLRNQSQRGAYSIEMTIKYRNKNIRVLSKYRSAFDLLRPFGIYLWLCILASIIIAPMTFVGLGKLDIMVKKKANNQTQSSNNWTSLTGALWFSYGTLMGECVTSARVEQLRFTLK